MSFSSQHAIVVTKSFSLADALLQQGHNVFIIPEGIAVLPLLIANPQTDLLILDKEIRDSQMILQTLN
jgi:hypothetical protein